MNHMNPMLPGRLHYLNCQTRVTHYSPRRRYLGPTRVTRQDATRGINHPIGLSTNGSRSQEMLERNTHSTPWRWQWTHVEQT